MLHGGGQVTAEMDVLGPVPLESLKRCSSSLSTFFCLRFGSDWRAVWDVLFGGFAGAAGWRDGSRMVSGTLRLAGFSPPALSSVWSVVRLRFFLSRDFLDEEEDAG